MELPDSVKQLGEQLDGSGEVAAPEELFEAYDVFAAELGQIFTQPWLAADHASRLTADGDFFRFEVGSRSVVVVRESADKIHAMRNFCLHAGYRVCEEESGRADHLFCQYHGWSYALDGRLTDPMIQPSMTDRSRFRLPRYAMRIERGLVLVDLSATAAEPPEAGAVSLGAVPDLSKRPVARRQRYQTTHNWKRLRQFLWRKPGVVFGNGECEAVEIGPLSLVAVRDGDAALVRLVPRFPGQTDCDVVMLPKPNANGRSGAMDPLGDVLREEEAAIAAAPLGRDFLTWYWPHMAPLATATA